MCRSVRKPWRALFIVDLRKVFSKCAFLENALRVH
jgi:hypothetical protein